MKTLLAVLAGAVIATAGAVLEHASRPYRPQRCPGCPHRVTDSPRVVP